MPQWLKWMFLALGTLLLLAVAAVAFYVYKVKYGFADDQTEPYAIDFPQNDCPAILVFSKTAGYRHAEAIVAAEKMLREVGKEQGWFVFTTEHAGVFNAEQLARFDVIVWNNSTGPVLTSQQEALVATYVEAGGGLVAIHGAGNEALDWPWYTAEVIGATFSHHPMESRLQEATVSKSRGGGGTRMLQAGIEDEWRHTDEWYVFDSHPSTRGFHYAYQINGDSIDYNGNMLWVRDKDFGMGPVHPVAWSKYVAKGRTFYTSMGHTSETFEKPEIRQLLLNAIKWAGRGPTAPLASTPEGDVEETPEAIDVPEPAIN